MRQIHCSVFHHFEQPVVVYKDRLNQQPPSIHALLNVDLLELSFWDLNAFWYVTIRRRKMFNHIMNGKLNSCYLYSSMYSCKNVFNKNTNISPLEASPVWGFATFLWLKSEKTQYFYDLDYWSYNTRQLKASPCTQGCFAIFWCLTLLSVVQTKSSDLSIKRK